MQVIKHVPIRVTLRLQTDLHDVLMEEANKRDLTINALINRILNKNMSYDINVNAVQCVTMPHELFLEMIDQMPTNSINEIGKSGPRTVKKLFSLLESNITFNMCMRI